jgi:carbamoyl-phosphate synthase large subunit
LNIGHKSRAKIAKEINACGFEIAGTEGTYQYFKKGGLVCEKTQNTLEQIKQSEFALVINTPTRGKQSGREGFKLRRTAVGFNVSCITSMDTVRSMLTVMQSDAAPAVIPLHEYK